ncbi:MAG: peptide chain release factor 2 [Cytophagales bacterium]|nr:peptide chain release factor 2 [Armatimonadota bacterium]
MDIFDLPKREQELARLEAEVAQPGLWDNPEKAQKTMQAVARARENVVPYKELTARYEDARTLLELAAAEEDGEAFADEISAELSAMRTLAEAMEVQTLLSGPHDAVNAILELKPGAGGTDACDWGAMLLRMYLRWAERSGFKAEIVSELPGDVAGISSATVFITGANAYGFLRSEHGVHRLVRISPFNANGKRQTSFVGVEVSPQIEDAGEVEIGPDDLEWDYFRASGAGGQHVNKTSSAVRLKHVPTGLIVECQNERSQHQNKEVALKILRGRLAERAEREAEAKMAALRGEQRAIEWGSQIRSYVFQPYTLVKDHRNGVETGDVQKVMDGGIESFQTGYLRWRAGDGGGGSNEEPNGSAAGTDLP